MIGRTQELRTAFDLVVKGESINIVSVRLNGRTTFLAELSKQLETRGWNVISIQGLVSLSSNPLTALQLAHIHEEPSSGGASAFVRFSEGLRHLASRPQSVIIVDDWNDIDEASWGIIDHARRTTGCSVVMSRLTGTTSNFTPSGLAGSAADASFVVSLPPLRFDELTQLLTARLGSPIDVSSAGTIFRKTNGVIGLAVAVADAAVREGHMRLIDGVWTAVADLWSDGIAGLIEGYLEPLNGDGIDALEMLSMIGTVDSNLLEDLIDWKTVEELESRSYLSFYATQGNDLATVQPPLLLDYFLHLRMPARRRRIRAHLSARLGEKAFPTLSQDLSAIESSGRPARADAHFARLSNERLSARWLVTKSEWEKVPSQESALAYVLALLAVNDPESQVAEVFAAAQTPDSGDQCAIELSIAQAKWIAIYQGDLDAALVVLAEASQKYPHFSRALAAAEVILKTSLIEVPADYHELFEETTEIPPWVRAHVLEAQTFVLNAVGRFQDSIKNYETRAQPEFKTPYIPSAQYALALLGVGQHAKALAWSLRAYDEAKATLDLPSACQHGYAAALALFSQGDYEQASEILDTVLSAGAHAPFVRVNRISILNLAGVLAVLRGNQEIGEAYAREAAALGAGPGPYPGQSGAWLRGHLLAYSGRTQDAADLLASDSQEQSDRGYTVAGLFAGILALDLTYSAEASARLRNMADEVDGSFFKSRLDYLDALDAEDPDALLSSATALVSAGLPGHALAALETASALLQSHGRNEEAERARTQGLELAEGLGDLPIDKNRLKTAAVKLTDREDEIAALVSEGMTNQQIATHLVVSVRTVESHLLRAMRKLGVSSRLELRKKLGPLKVDTP